MTPPADILERPMRAKGNIAGELAEHVSPVTVIRRDEPMAGHTTLRVGGPADAYVEPASEANLAAIVKFCGAHGVPFFVIGRGSNLLVRDGGFRGAVICLSHANFAGIEFTGERLRCGAGAKLKSVAVEARRHSLSGMEFLEGIPGSVGGALRMNAGAMGGATFDVVESVRLMDFDGNIRELAAGEMSVKYRGCATLKNHIALDAVFKGRPDSPESIAQRMSAFSQKRWASQPAAPSAGCAFKNPPSIPAGKLIDELGLKGARVGGAVVSQEHGNFIVNDGNATARDVLELISILKAKAKAERGIELRTEVEIVGEDR
jgi:UDP-N-acetylenolpyruvoylglucosamine reductase